MSRFKKITKKCAVCGREQEFTVLMSSNSHGCMDLDTRPPQMMRSTLPYQIEICKSCYYANTDIEELSTESIKNIMKMEEYQDISNLSISNTSIAYLLSGLIYYEIGDYEKSAFLYLKAAWTLDDAHDIALSTKARVRSYRSFSKYLESEDNINYKIIIVDLFRRCKSFDRAISAAEELLKIVTDEFLRKILLYQIKLSKAEDSSCHTVGEV